MKDLIAKLHLDANCALGAIWLHIDAQAARIAELEAQIASESAPTVGKEWKSLNDVQWMNIVNHDHAYFGWDKEDAVHHAVKATEAKLRELNSTALQAPVREVPDSNAEKLGETCIDGGKCHHECKDKCFRRDCCSPLSDYTGPWAYPALTAAPVQQEG